jgi:hypothetical protein
LASLPQPLDSAQTLPLINPGLLQPLQSTIARVVSSLIVTLSLLSPIRHAVTKFNRKFKNLSMKLSWTGVCPSSMKIKIVSIKELMI